LGQGQGHGSQGQRRARSRALTTGIVELAAPQVAFRELSAGENETPEISTCQ
jgi:hypothetical protein